MTSWQRFLMGPPNVPDNDRSNWLTILHRVSDRQVYEVVDLCVCVLHLCVLFCVRVGVWVHICVFVCVCIHVAGVINIVAMSRCTLVRIDRMWVVSTTTTMKTESNCVWLNGKYKLTLNNTSRQETRKLESEKMSDKMLDGYLYWPTTTSLWLKTINKKMRRR